MPDATTPEPLPDVVWDLIQLELQRLRAFIRAGDVNAFSAATTDAARRRLAELEAFCAARGRDRYGLASPARTTS